MEQADCPNQTAAAAGYSVTLLTISADFAKTTAKPRLVRNVRDWDISNW